MATEDDTQMKLVDAATKAFCDESMHSIWRTFYESTEVIQKMCNINPDYEMIPLGTGFDALPIPLYTKPDEHIESYFELKRPPQFQQMLCVHRHSIVLPSDNCTSTQYRRPLVFHMEQTNPGFCSVSPSPETVAALQNSEDLLIEREPNQDGQTTTTYSSEDFQTNVRKSCDIFLNINRRTVGHLDEDIQSKNPVERNKKEEGSLQNIHAMDPVGALLCPLWSSGMTEEWKVAHKESVWPPNDIKIKIPSMGFHVEPHKEEIVDERENLEDEPSSEKKFEWKWKLNFKVAEQYLFKHFNTKQRQIVYCVLGLISRFREINQIRELNKLLRHSFLHFFSNNAIDSSDEVSKCTEHILQFIVQCLEKEKCANYFIPTCNLLDGISGEVRKGFIYVLKSTLRHLKTSLIGSKYLPIQTYINKSNGPATKISFESFTNWLSRYCEAVKQSLKISLLKTFDDIVNLLMMTSFAQHCDGSVDESIARHEDMLKMLSGMKDVLTKDHKLIAHLGDIVERFGMFVQVNLGTLYHCKAVQTEDNEEKDKYYRKAEECLQSGYKCDLAYGSIRLAHLLYHRGMTESAMSLLRKTMAHLGNDQNKQSQILPEALDNTNFVAFRKELWRPWVQGRYAFDIMFCKMLNPLCPAEMTKSFTLAQCQMLGIRVQSIATFSPQFFSSYLLALCHMGENEQYSQADKILSKAEEMCLEELQTDLNDKRIASYLNIITRCYLGMENLGRARYVIHNSLNIYPSPRNPARFMRYQLDYGNSLGYVKQGFKIVVFSAVTYAVVQYVRVHYRSNLY